MVRALTTGEARNVREFIDYPANLGDIPQLMEEPFDVVMIDIDSDQSYAMQIIQSIAAYNTSIVMAYSMRNDPDLIRDCMRAGARDFLPLPEEGLPISLRQKPRLWQSRSLSPSLNLSLFRCPSWWQSRNLRRSQCRSRRWSRC